jgi:hypothetical protein
MDGESIMGPTIQSSARQTQGLQLSRPRERCTAGRWPHFAQGLEGITFLAGWVGGSWLIFHLWRLPVAPVVLTVPPDQWVSAPTRSRPTSDR